MAENIILSRDESHLEIIVGTYEEIVLGYKLSYNDKKVPFLDQSFTNHSHAGSIKCVAYSNPYLATAGTDEIIRIFNMYDRREFGLLSKHDGTVKTMEFIGSTHLISGSEDHTISVFDTSAWQCQKTLSGHKSSVNSISVHPSGKILLSVGKDKSLRTWNLVKGRSAYVTNIKQVSDIVRWSPDGLFYAVVLGSKVDIYSIETAGITQTVDFGKRINSIVFLNNDLLALAGEKESLDVYNISENKLMYSLDNKTTRINAICTQVMGEVTYLSTCSSDGLIKLWRFPGETFEVPELVCEVNCGFRISCATLAHVTKAKRHRLKKRKMVGNVTDTADVDKSKKSKKS